MSEITPGKGGQAEFGEHPERKGVTKPGKEAAKKKGLQIGAFTDKRESKVYNPSQVPNVPNTDAQETSSVKSNESVWKAQDPHEPEAFIFPNRFVTRISAAATYELDDEDDLGTHIVVEGYSRDKTLGSKPLDLDASLKVSRVWFTLGYPDPENPDTSEPTVIRHEEVLSEFERGTANNILNEAKNRLDAQRVERDKQKALTAELEAQYKEPSPETRNTPPQEEQEQKMALKRAERQKELDAIVVDKEIEFRAPETDEPIIEDEDGIVKGTEILSHDGYTYLEVVAQSDPTNTSPYDAFIDNTKKTLLYKIDMVTVSLPVGESDDPNRDLSIVRTPLLENGIFTGTLNALKHGKELYAARVEEMGLETQFTDLGEVDVKALEQEIAAKEKMEGYMKSIAAAYLETLMEHATEENIATYLEENGETIALRIQETQLNLELKMRQMTDVYLMGNSEPTDAEITTATKKAKLYIAKLMGFISNADVRSSESLEISVTCILSALRDQEGFAERMQSYDDDKIVQILQEIDEETQGTTQTSERKRIPIEHIKSKGRAVRVNIKEASEGEKAEKKFAKQVEQMKEVYREVYRFEPSDESHIPETLHTYQTYWENEIHEKTKIYQAHPSVTSESDREEAQALAERAVLDEISRQVGKKIDDPAKMGLAYYKEFVRDPNGLAERIRRDREASDREDEQALSAVEADAWGLVADVDIDSIAIDPEFPDEL